MVANNVKSAIHKHLKAGRSRSGEVHPFSSAIRRKLSELPKIDQSAFACRLDVKRFGRRLDLGAT